MTGQPARRATETKSKRNLIIVLAALLTVELVLSACSNPPPPPAATPQSAEPTKTLPEIDDHILSAAVEGDRLVVDVKATAVFNDGDVLDSLSDVIQRTGTALQERTTSANFKDVAFNLSSPGSDRLGKEVMIPMISATFSADDLRQANFKNLTADRTLDLATSARYLSPAGGHAVVIYCLNQAKANGGAATPFCELYRRQLVGSGR